MRLTILTLTIGLLLVSGCGKKGPLYLPEEEPPKQAQFDSTSPNDFG